MVVEDSGIGPVRPRFSWFAVWRESRIAFSCAMIRTGEIAMVLGSSMRYDIAEVVDPQVHLVAKLSKSALAQLPKP